MSQEPNKEFKEDLDYLSQLKEDSTFFFVVFGLAGWIGSAIYFETFDVSRAAKGWLMLLAFFVGVLSGSLALVPGRIRKHRKGGLLWSEMPKQLRKDGVNLAGNLFMIGAFFSAAFLGFAALYWIYEKAVYLASHRRVCVEERYVMSVGGCSAFGTCGVTFDDGSHGELKYPAYGQMVCVKKEWRIPAAAG